MSTRTYARHAAADRKGERKRPASAPPSPQNVPGTRPALMSRALLVRFVSLVGAAISFNLLLSVVPLYAISTGASGEIAGLANGAMLFAAVAGELATGRLVTRYGYRRVLMGGLLLLGAPAFALIAAQSVASILTVCVLRGVGFAITCVAGGALTASIIPPERRGEGLALVGVAAGVPAMAALPLGVLLIGRVGYAPIFAAGGVAALAAAASVLGLPDRERSPARPLGIIVGLRTPALVRPAIIFLATTIAAGIIVTYLPVAVPQASRSIVVLALLIQPAASMLMRGFAGQYGDRRGAACLLLPGLVLAATGILVFALTAGPAALIAGALLFGVGFGVAQNASLAVMYARVPVSSYTTVSTLWNAAYDAGMGLGAAGFGLLTAATGSSAAFAITAAVMLVALVPAFTDRKPPTVSSDGGART